MAPRFLYREVIGIVATSRRSDARRNRDAIVRAAAAEVERRGAEASLEEIARVAGVGSATLHRHFPSRRALMQEVFHDRVAAFGASADELAQRTDPVAALRRWFRDLASYSAATRGLVAALDLSVHGLGDGGEEDTCETVLLAAAGSLLTGARATGSVRGDVSAADLLGLLGAIAASSPDPGTAGRLMDLVLDGTVTGTGDAAPARAADR